MLRINADKNVGFTLIFVYRIDGKVVVKVKRHVERDGNEAKEVVKEDSQSGKDRGGFVNRKEVVFR